ncbi:MAG: mechanosensitive ion channel family protein [Pseudomonadota bacterium]
MENILTSIHAYASHTILGIGLIILLLGYNTIARKIKRIPVIPFGLIILYLLLRIASNYLNLFDLATWYKWIYLSSVAALYCGVVRLLFFLFIEKIMLWWKNKTLPKITRDFILIVIYAIIILVLLRTQGKINLAGLITTSAVLTAAIGFGAQKTIGNLFAGLTLQMDRPYQIGDWIKVGDHIGEVIGITWKLTRLKTRSDEIICIPNQEITSSVITNYTKPTRRHRAKFEIGVTYDTEPNRLKNTIVDFLKQHPDVINQPEPEVFLVQYGDFAINYEVRFYHRDYDIEPKILSDIKTKLWYVLKRNQIHIPFPIRTIQHHHIEERALKAGEKKKRENVLSILKKLSLFEALNEEEITQLAHDVKTHEYGKGEAVVRQGDPGKSMYIIKHGELSVALGSRPQEGNVLAVLTDNDFFGEMSLLTGEPRSANVTANRDSLLFKIDKESFSKIIQADPKISENLAEVLAKRQGEIDKSKSSLKAIDKNTSQILGRIKNFFGIK